LNGPISLQLAGGLNIQCRLLLQDRRSAVGAVRLQSVVAPPRTAFAKIGVAGECTRASTVRGGRRSDLAMRGSFISWMYFPIWGNLSRDGRARQNRVAVPPHAGFFEPAC